MPTAHASSSRGGNGHRLACKPTDRPLCAVRLSYVAVAVILGCIALALFDTGPVTTGTTNQPAFRASSTQHQGLAQQPSYTSPTINLTVSCPQRPLAHTQRDLFVLFVPNCTATTPFSVGHINFKTTDIVAIGSAADCREQQHHAGLPNVLYFDVPPGLLGPERRYLALQHLVAAISTDSTGARWPSYRRVVVALADDLIVQSDPLQAVSALLAATRGAIPRRLLLFHGSSTITLQDDRALLQAVESGFGRDAVATVLAAAAPGSDSEKRRRATVEDGVIAGTWDSICAFVTSMSSFVAGHPNYMTAASDAQAHSRTFARAAHIWALLRAGVLAALTDAELEVDWASHDAGPVASLRQATTLDLRNKDLGVNESAGPGFYPPLRFAAQPPKYAILSGYTGRWKLLLPDGLPQQRRNLSREGPFILEQPRGNDATSRRPRLCVIGSVWGADNSRIMGPSAAFLRSVRLNADPSIRIILLTRQDAGTDNWRSLTKHFDAELVIAPSVGVNGDWNPSATLLRHFEVRTYLLQQDSDTRCDVVATVDVRDMYWQSDLFDTMKRNADGSLVPAFYTAYETAGRDIVHEIYNAGWVHSCFGVAGLKSMRGKRIINAGLSWATRDAYLAYVDQFLEYSRNLTCLSVGGIDQGMHEFMIHSGTLATRLGSSAEVIVFSMEDGPVQNVAIAASLQINSDLMVLNEAGATAVVVHQYDRFEELTKVVHRRYYPLARLWR